MGKELGNEERALNDSWRQIDMYFVGGRVGRGQEWRRNRIVTLFACLN